MAAKEVSPPATVLPPVAMPSAVDEANHRFANHLQLLAALVSVEARSIADPECRAALTRTLHRIAALGGVHRHLYRNDDVTVNLAEYLVDLGEHLGQSSPDHRAIRVDAQPMAVSGALAASIGVLVTELVTNACKHAYALDEAGDILIRLRGTSERSYECIVEDHGRGLSHDVKGMGLGRRLIEGTVGQLGATLTIENAHPGTRYRIAVGR